MGPFPLSVPEIEPDHCFSSIEGTSDRLLCERPAGDNQGHPQGLRKMKLAMRPHCPSLRYEKKRSGSPKVQ
jgi:hypothetical protein